MSQEAKIKASGRKVFVVGLIALVVIAAIVLCMNVFLTPNRSAEAAGKAAFEGIYKCDYDKFVKATIYNEKCQNALNMDISADLAEIEPLFEEMKAWMDETGESYSVKKADAVEYDALHEKYAEGIELFKEAYDGVYDNLIEKVAVVTVEYTANYADVTGEWVTEDDTEEYWCFYVDGGWYAFPMIGSYEE